ncbi:unnamed protein product [Coffea canephora]|uniref:Uncharacterized protein n=1 Tax=Coffea canephora TaxID=49390 RepID=A0A068TY29_COFCA|nr:unnamed protein product [Coffea canephora]
MKSRLAPTNWPFAAVLFFCSLISDLSAEVQRAGESGEVGSRYLNIGRRALMGFKETPNGGNITYECSPSGPCVPCAYSEKNDEKYRCSETGYRIPLKCVDTGSDSKEANGKKLQKGRSALESMKVMQPVNMNSGDKLTIMASQRHLLDESTTSDDGRQAYITYRSCIPAANEEKLSVLGFEGIMVGLLLISGSAIYFRRKRANAVPGGQARVPNNSRF